MSGKTIRTGKLFGAKKNLVISALDHVVEYGYQPGIESAPKAIRNCLSADAVLMDKTMLQRNANLMAKPTAAAPIIRLNWSTSFYYPLDYREGHTTSITTVEEAVQAGAEAVICSLFLEEHTDQRRETENVGLFAEVARETERFGLPLIGECYVVEHNEITWDQLHEKVRRVSRIMAELGADFIKTFYTGERFHEVVENTPVPVFTIGAEKMSTDLAVLKKASDSVQQGARGIIFGRNIFTSDHPRNLISALRQVINKGEQPDEMAHRYGLKV